MTGIGVTAVSTYLAAAGWSRTDRSWHGAAIWSNGSEEVLVPPRDGMGDSVARLRELLQALAEAEQRPAAEIAREMAYPLLDSASYQGQAVSGPEGFVPLYSGLGALQGVHDLFSESATAVLSSSLFPTDHAVSDLLAGVHLGTTPGREFALTLLVPLSNDSASAPSLGRRTLMQMHTATLAVREAVNASDPGALEATARLGVTSAFCTALSSLAGDQLQQPFSLGFRWARGVPSTLPDQRLDFPPGAGEVIRAASQRLDTAAAGSAVAAASPVEAGPVTVLGRIEALHDNQGGTDRWRIKVRGVLLVDGRRTARRSLWIRLTDQDQYEVALAAHRQHHAVRIHGSWTEAARGARIRADPDGLEIAEPGE